MVDNKTVLDWINSVCREAIKQAHDNDHALMNRLGSNPATKLYFDNVHGLHSVQESQFPAYYSGQWKEITRLYEEYMREQAVTESVDKVDKLEARFSRLESMITEFLEGQTAPESPKPPKQGKKPTNTQKEEPEATPSEDEPTEEA